MLFWNLKKFGMACNFLDENCTECEQTQAMIELVDKTNPEKVVAYACSKCRFVRRNGLEAIECCVPKKCEDCKQELRRKDFYLRCLACAAKHETEKQRRILDKAKKLDAKEYTGRVLYSEGRDQYYFEGVFEYLEDAENDGVDPEEYLWGCVSYGLHIDADSVIDSATEEHHEDAYYECDHDGLQKLLDEWCAKQGVETFTPDYTTAVRVPPRAPEEGKA